LPDPISLHLSLPYLAAALGFGYLLGSIPFGLLLTRISGLGDIRSIGSGNIGATNVLRTGNKPLAAATLLLDGFKGTAACLLAARFGPETAIVAGFGAFLGHLFPIWLRFKGGKGVATYAGVLLALSPPAFGVFGLVWLVTAIVTRYSSLSALMACLAVPLFLVMTGYVQLAELFAVMSLITYIKHRANIARLIAGTESRIGRKEE